MRLEPLSFRIHGVMLLSSISIREAMTAKGYGQLTEPVKEALPARLFWGVNSLQTLEIRWPI